MFSAGELDISPAKELVSFVSERRGLFYLF
jgi:hypothetical protein